MADYISKFQYNGTTWDMKDAEARQALASCVNNGYYDSNAKKIILRHGNTTIVQIDATDFIKDGMVSNVQVVNGYLVITFNTDAGQEPIRIPITDIFNPDNYYTKSATNGLLALKQDLIQDLAQIRQGASAGSTAYQKPQGGIPKSDMSEDVKEALQKAEDAITEEEVENQYARQDGYYESLGAGEAKNIIGQIPQDAGFIYRTAGGGSEIADGLSHVKKIQGNVVSWNQLVNPTTIESQKVDGFTITNNRDGSVTLNGTVNQYWILISFLKGASQNPQHPYNNPTHKYYIHTYIGINNFESDLSGSPQIKLGTEISKGGGYPKLVAYKNTTFVNTVIKPILIDLTIIYGAGKEPTTVEQFEADYQRWFGKPLDYEPYNAGTLIPMKMQGIKTVGFNQYNPATGIVKGLVVDGGYQITGTYTSITQDGVEITPNTNGIFTIEKAGDIVVNGGDDTTCVHFVYDGHRNGEYESYKEHNYDFDVTRVWGKLNGEGSYVQIAPDGFKSATSINSSSDLQNAIADLIEFGEDGVTADVKVGQSDLGTNSWIYGKGSRIWYITAGHFSNKPKSNANKILARTVGAVTVNPSDYRGTMDIILQNNNYNNENYNEFISFMQGVKIYYELATPLHYTDLMLDTSVAGDGSQLEPLTALRPIVDNYGTEEIIVPASQDATPTSCNPWVSIQYDINAAEHIDTFEKHGIKDVALHDNLQALCNVINTNCSEQLSGTISISAEPNDSLVYSFTFTANAQTQSVAPQNETI